MYSCSQCHKSSLKWAGKCENCGAWGTLLETAEPRLNPSPRASIPIIKLSDVSLEALSKTATGLPELDAILGGGLIPGSLILLGGEPGIGKSTFALQLADKLLTAGLPAQAGKGDILYICGEESPIQIKNRAERLSVRQDRFHMYPNPHVDDIIQASIQQKPALTIIDSIQTIYCDDIPSETGSPTQIRGAAQKILEHHKEHQISTLIIGQITKDGSIAGPKMLEHLVDTVFYLEGEKDTPIRLLRIMKNRFGPTDEICLFKMTPLGLQSIQNINEETLNLRDRPKDICGAAFTAESMSNKIFMLEIQALVTPTVFGYPQRKTVGIDVNRLQILSAVISKFTKTNLNNCDIHLTVSSGQKSQDPSSDLAIAAAIISSKNDIAIPQDAIFVGEVGLGGEIKPARNLSYKLKEAEKLGFKTAFIPQLPNEAMLKESKMALKQIKNIQFLNDPTHN